MYLENVLKCSKMHYNKLPVVYWHYKMPVIVHDISAPFDVCTYARARAIANY